METSLRKNLTVTVRRTARNARGRAWALLALSLAGGIFGTALAGAAPLGTNSLYGTSNGLLSGALLGQAKAGADGDIWFLDNNKGVSPFGNKAIGQLNPTTHAINEYPLPNGVPGFLGAGPDGSLWVSVVGVSAIDQVIPNGALPPTINVIGTRSGSSPYQLGKGPDGNLWFTDRGTPKAVGLVCLTVSPLCAAADVASHASHEYTSTGTPCPGTAAVCVGSLYAGDTPRFLAAGPDGNVWFTDAGSVPAIGEVNAANGALTEWSVALNGGSAHSAPGTIEAGPDGNLWFADAGTSPAIGEFNLTTAPHAITEYGQSDGLQSGSLINGTMEGPDGNMWFTDSSTTVGDAPIEMICLTVSPLCTTTEVGMHAIREFPFLTYPTSIGNSGGIGSDGNLWWVDLSTIATPGGEAIGQFGLGVCGGNSLAGCDMRDVDLQNISIDGANLRGSDLQDAQLENASLVGANLQGANLQGAKFQHYANLNLADIQGANIRDANLAGAELVAANLQGSNLQDASLAGANLTDASIMGANLEGADLTDADLAGADLAGANLRGATLTGVTWSNTTCPDGTDSAADGGACASNGGALKPSLPAVTTAGATTPGVTVPGVTVPGVTVPGVTVPAVTVPAVTVPGVTTPSVTTPSSTTPGVTTPAVTTPAVTTPAVTTPAVTTPAMTTTPTITVPAIKVP